jgi:DNA-directed RNA polymerase I subunit RPA49
MHQNMRELRNDLGQTFGTKKAKKAIASVTENAISPDKADRLANGGRSAKLDSGAMAVLANIGEVAAGMATQEELAQEAEATKPRPQGNFNATDIKDVYTVEVLIGIDIMVLIPVKEWKDTITSKQEIRTSSRYVSNRLGRGTLSVEKLKLLRYMLLLIEFFAKARPARGGRLLPKRDEVKQILNGMPEAVLEGVKRKFTTAGMLNKYQSDLLITHLCAMAFLVDNFEVDMYDLQLDLRLETKEMSQYFHEIGAKVGAFSASEGRKMGLEKAAIAQRRTAKLKLPLDFPKVSFGRKR